MRRDLHLVVKGNKLEAAKAAANRGIPFRFRLETKHNETCGYVQQEYADKVQAWFLEDSSNPAPYETGSLLVYRWM